jgi:hypothetical protein
MVFLAKDTALLNHRRWEMKKHRLAGVLLAASTALLLAGGVALAAARMTIEPYCNVCCAECNEPSACDGWGLSTSGWTFPEGLFVTLTSPGPAGSFGPYTMFVNPDGTCSLDIYLMCPECAVGSSVQVLGDYLPLYYPWEPGDYGEWAVELGGISETVQAGFYFAEDPGECQVAFVPEAGSILLLGSGLAGLAGYATLRWKTRE